MDHDDDDNSNEDDLNDDCDDDDGDCSLPTNRIFSKKRPGRF